MSRLKIFYTLFYLAALMFIAKPFLGFSAIELNQSVNTHNLLIKSFTTRKPDDLEDAKNKAIAIHQQITSPPVLQILTIAALLAFIFSSAFKLKYHIHSFFAGIKSTAFYPEDTYLLHNKLII